MAVSFANLPKFLVKHLMPALRALPPRAALKVVSDLGRLELAMNPPRRRLYADAVRRGSRLLGADWDPLRTGSDLAANRFRWRARDLLLDGLPDDRAAAYFRVEGEGHLRSAFDRGRGVVLLFNHFGPFLMPAHWVVRRGYPLRWFTERPRQISRLLSRDFGDDGPLGQKGLFISRKLTPEQGSAAIRRAIKVLRAGMVVQIAGDVRWSGPRTVPGTLLGRPYRFTTTWVSLAALSGAPVVGAWSTMEPDGSCAIRFAEPFDVPADALRTGEAARLVQGNLDGVEARIRSHPQDSLDYLFWSERDPVGGVGP